MNESDQYSLETFQNISNSLTEENENNKFLEKSISKYNSLIFSQLQQLNQLVYKFNNFRKMKIKK